MTFIHFSVHVKQLLSATQLLSGFIHSFVYYAKCKTFSILEGHGQFPFCVDFLKNTKGGFTWLCTSGGKLVSIHQDYYRDLGSNYIINWYRISKVTAQTLLW